MIRHSAIMAGKTVAARMPAFMFSPKASETKPTRVGPEEQPRSPASARSANIAVPPVRSEDAARLKVPGHIMPTEKPHIAQPIRLSNGQGESEASRYAHIQSTALDAMNFSRFILAPYLP